MAENKEFQYSEYKEPVNYIQSIIFALLGGIIALAAWLGPVYFADYVYYIAFVAVGIGAGLGARGLNRKHSTFGIVIVALLATIVCLIIGDIAETAIVNNGFDFTMEQYITYFTAKVQDDPTIAAYYAGALIISAVVAFTPSKTN